MKGEKFKEGELYLIRFYDHSIGEDKELEIEAVGWFFEETKLSVSFTSWRVDTEDKDLEKDNREPFHVLKSAIISVRKL